MKCKPRDPDCYCLATCRAVYGKYMLMSWVTMKVILLLDLNLLSFGCDSNELNTFCKIFTPQLFHRLL